MQIPLHYFSQHRNYNVLLFVSVNFFPLVINIDGPNPVIEKKVIVIE